MLIYRFNAVPERGSEKRRGLREYQGGWGSRNLPSFIFPSDGECRSSEETRYDGAKLRRRRRRQKEG
ncbi:hypothetical protein SLA2020_524980 [Shorea laevis]